MRPLHLFCAAAALSAAAPALADDLSVWRLFVADHAEGRVSIVDLTTPDVVDSVDLTAPARLYGGAGGRAVFAVQGSADRIDAIASGITVSDHGDHADLSIADPALLDAPLEGERPVHFVEHNGEIAVFFDGSGAVDVLDANAWADGDVEIVRSLETAAPHHGVAVPWGDHDIVTVPHPDDPEALPIGVEIRDATGAPYGDLVDCPELHGEASSGNVLAIACATGVLFVTGSGTPEIVHAPYDGLPEGKATTLLGGVGLQYFLSNFGPDRVALIEPGTPATFRFLDLPTRRVHFAVDPVRPRFAYVFTEDGSLHRLDVVTASIDDTLSLTAPYSMDGHWSDPRPRIAVAGDVIAVTDPAEGLVRLVDAESFEPTGEIAIEGVPFDLVAIGGSGTAH